MPNIYSTVPVSTTPFAQTVATDVPMSSTQELFKLMGVSPESMPSANATTHALPTMNTVPCQTAHLQSANLNAEPIKANHNQNTRYQSPKTHITLQRGQEFLQITDASLEHPGNRLNITYQGEPAIDSNGLLAESITAAFQQLIEANCFTETFNQTHVVREGDSWSYPASQIKEVYERIGHLLAITALQNQHSPTVLTDIPLDESLFAETIALSPSVETHQVPNFANGMLDFAATCDLPLNCTEAHNKDISKIFQQLFGGADHSTSDLNTLLQRLNINIPDSNTLAHSNSAQTSQAIEPNWIANLNCSAPVKSTIHHINQYFWSDSEQEFLTALVDKTLPKLALALGFNAVSRNSTLAAAIDNSEQFRQLVCGKSLISDEYRSWVAAGQEADAFFDQRFAIDPRSNLTLQENEQMELATQIRAHCINFLDSATTDQIRDFTIFVSGSAILPKNRNILITATNGAPNNLPEAKNCDAQLFIQRTDFLADAHQWQTKLLKSIALAKEYGNGLK